MGNPLPSFKTDSFEMAGVTKGGAVHARVAEWDYQAATAKSGAKYQGTFDVFERPGQHGISERVFDGFWLDGGSLWKLKELALACGLSYNGPVDWSEVAQDCIGREFWGFLEVYDGKDGRKYTRFAKFASNLADLEKAAATVATVDKSTAGRF